MNSPDTFTPEEQEYIDREKNWIFPCAIEKCECHLPVNLQTCPECGEKKFRVSSLHAINWCSHCQFEQRLPGWIFDGSKYIKETR